MSIYYLNSSGSGSSYWTDDGTYLSPTTSTRHIKLVDNEKIYLGTDNDGYLTTDGVNVSLINTHDWVKLSGENGVVIGYNGASATSLAVFRTSGVTFQRSLGLTGHLSTSSYISQTDGATSYFKLGNLTTTERDALTAVAGMVIFNSTTTQFEGYDGSSWVAL